jgi:hypothetical protein
METLFNFIGAFLNIYLLCFFVWAILSWIPQFAPSLMQNPVVSGIQGFLNSIILPWVKLFSFVRPLQLGNVMLDMSSLVAFLVLIVITNMVFPIARGAVVGGVLLIALVHAHSRTSSIGSGAERSNA